MSLFKGLTNDGLENSQDRLGGYAPIETDIYIATIKALYAGTSSKGATSVTLLADINGKEYRETFYVTNKKGENFFMNKDDRTKKVPLPGFTVVDDICMIATGKPLAEQDTEEKIINVYNFDHKREEPTTVPMLTEALGQKVALGILKQLENKNALQGDEYVATPETRELNVVDKVFHPEVRLTLNEARNGQEEPKFWDAWAEKNKGQVRDKRTIKDGEGGAAAGRPTRAAPSASSTAAPATKSLFGKKS